MSDQGHGGNGQDGPPEWNQPNYGAQPGPGGQQYPTEQFPGQPYGAQQYPTQQFPGQPYGEPQYPGQYATGQYEQQFNPYSGAAPANSGKSQKGIFIGLAAVAAIGAVVLVLALTGVFSSNDSTTTDSPRSAAEKVLLASKNSDLNGVKAGLCQQDRNDPQVIEIVGDERATAYTINSVEQTGTDQAVVKARITTKTKTDDAELPVIKENGSWKVCFSARAGTNSSSGIVPRPSFSVPRPSFSVPSLPTFPSITVPPINVPSIPSSFCASSVSASATARLFVSGITIKSISLAEGCIYQNRVSQSQLQALTSSGNVYSPFINTGDEGPVFTFKSVTGATILKVTVEKQSDGKYYVVDATAS
ncbi:MAG: hypothetical protein ABI345_12170 [Jatrophihabitans sp.]